MKYKGIEVLTATVHDFAKREEELWAATFIESKEEYLKDASLDDIISDLLTLAEETGNFRLKNAILDTFFGASQDYPSSEFL